MLRWWSSKSRKAAALTQPAAASDVTPSASAGQEKAMAVRLQVKQDSSGHVSLSLLPPDCGSSPPLDVCIVIDTSGSMSDAANAEGPEEIKLFSKMDLARRGAEVIARSLTPADTLTILGFQSTVTQWLERTHMDAQGLAAALEKLALLRPCGGTALWDGLCAGLQQMEVPPPTDKATNRLAAVILLTDGQPCPSPPEGEIAALLKYQGAHKASADHDRPLICSKLVTLGFGYDVNSKLLVDLAHTHGLGSNTAFIPDGTMLLTNFVNLMANLKSCYMRGAVLRLSPPTGQGVRDVAHALDAAFTTDGTSAPAPVNVPSILSVLGERTWTAVPVEGGVALEVQVGDLLYGCPRHVVLQEQGSGSQPDWSSWTAELHFNPVVPGCSTSRVDLGCPQPVVVDTPFVTQQLHRALAVSAIHQASRLAAIDLPGAQLAIKDCALATMGLQGGPLLQGLEPHPVVEDLLGQVSEALSTKENWSRWGAHYLRSLMCAHQAEACNNFKDPGVQAYTSSYTRRQRDELNTMCDSLPVPTPSIRNARTVLGQPVNVSLASFTHTFNNQHGGCFGPGGLVLMADGSHTAVEELRKGDVVASVNGTAARVVCVVRSSGAQVLQLPGSKLSITPWHPVRLGGAWHFPADLLQHALLGPGGDGPAGDALRAGVHTPGTVYNLVLDGGHVLVIDGVEAVTLGHGFQDPVVRHPFYGTEAVLHSLRQLPGWQQGKVELVGEGYTLDPGTGRVQGLSQTAAPAPAAAAAAAAAATAALGPQRSAPSSLRLVEAA